MKQMKLVSIVLALVLTVFLAATSFANTLEEIVKRGELRVAVQSGAPPYAFIDKTGVPAGSMVDFTQGMADAMGVKLKVLDYDWDGLIPALLSGKADILAADMTPTLKRALKVTFSDPWIYVQPCIFTKTEAPYQTLEDVNKPDVTVGVLLGSTGEVIAKKYLPNAKIKSYKGGGRMIVQALEAGHVDAGVNDDLAVLTVLPDFPPNSIRLLDKRLGQGKDPLAFAVRPESVNLWQWINLYFKTIRSNGEYGKNIRYWMEGIEWKKDH
jgi:polar amino acid transport system substrate-binding protein